MVIGWWVTGNPVTGLKIGGIEMFTKMILYYYPRKNLVQTESRTSSPIGNQKKGKRQMNQLKLQNYRIGRTDFEKRNKHRGMALWFTGLSGSGKSTLANVLHKKLFDRGIHSIVLDGDNTRLGINKDLGFSTRIEKKILDVWQKFPKILLNLDTL